MKRILILGGGIQQLPAIRAARGLHIHTTVFDKNQKALGSRESSVFFPIDIYNEAAAVEYAKSLHENHAFDGVMTMGTDCSTTVARIAEELGLPGMNYAAATTLKDKAAFRTFCRSHDLPIPDFHVFTTDKEDLDGAIDFFEKKESLPCVLKPTTSMGARGVCIIRSVKDIKRMVKHTAQYATNGCMIIEQMVSMPEYSVDAFVLNKKVVILGIANRHIALAPNRIELGHELPSYMDVQGLDEIKELLHRVAELLNIESGALKGDIFYDAGKIVLGELAGRLSGGYMSGWTIPLAYGIEPAQIAVLSAVGRTPSKAATTPTRAKFAGEQAIVSMPGIIESIEGSKTCIQHAWCKHIFLLREIGTKVPYPKNNTEKVGNILFTAATRRELQMRKQYISDHFHVLLAPCADETTHFLFSHKDESDFPALGCPLPRELKTAIKSHAFPDTIQPWPKEKFDLHLDAELYAQYVALQEKQDSIDEPQETRATTDAAFFLLVHMLEQKDLLIVRKKPMRNADLLLFHAMHRGGAQALYYLRASMQHDSTERFTQTCYELYLQRFS